MSGFLRGLGDVAKVAGGIVQGHQMDRTNKLNAALSQRKQQQDEERDRVLNVLTGSQIRQTDTETANLTAPLPKPAALKRSQFSYAMDDTPDVERLGSMDEGGNYYGADQAPLTGGFRGYRQPLRDPVADHLAERKDDVANPLPATAGGDRYVFTSGADGILRGNTATGTLEPTGQQSKPPLTRIESATQDAARKRMSAAVSEMNNAHTGLTAYEERLRNGTASISGLEQFGGRIANTFTHDDPASMAIQATALTALNKVNPELARYIRRSLSFAEGESMISQRPSDYRTKLSAFLSGASAGADAGMIDDIQSRRNSIMTPLNAPDKNAPVASTGGRGGGPGAGGSVAKRTITNDQAAFLKAKGMSDAEIAAKYIIGK